MSALQDASQLQLERFRRAWRGSALPGLLRWWGGELAALMPVRWREAFAGGERWYAVERHDTGWQMRRAGESLQTGPRSPLAHSIVTSRASSRCIEKLKF